VPGARGGGLPVQNGGRVGLLLPQLGRLRGQVDCVAEQPMCQEHQVAGYPSIRVFRKGHDEISMCAARASHPPAWRCTRPPRAARRVARPPKTLLAAVFLPPCLYLYPYQLETLLLFALLQCTHASDEQVQGTSRRQSSGTGVAAEPQAPQVHVHASRIVSGGTLQTRL